LVKNIQNNFGGDFFLTSTGNNKLYDTNVNERILINDFKYNSINKITPFGFLSNYEILVKNFNIDSKNSSKYKNKRSHDLQSILNYQIKYPLKKIGKKYDSFLTPILSVRYSPNKSKNIKNEDIMIDYNNIFSLNRISVNDTVEGGQSFTIGNEFRMLDKLDNELLSLNLATVIRDEINPDLPLSSKLGNTSSDIVGEIKLKPKKFLNLEYNFSLDNDLSRLDYSKANAEISINNFITSFEFLEKNNIIGTESYLSNKTTFNFDDNNSFEFSTRKNKEKDLTEYYNLIYQYKNDCLRAAIEYKKDYYTDGDLKPEEQLFFSITIVPFGKTSTPGFNK
jgi:LPS-assembly protein